MSQWKAHPTFDGMPLAPGHYSDIFKPDRFRQLVKDTDHALQAINKRVPFDAIATCGSSGNLLGAALSYEMGIPLVVIRKACEYADSHHGYQVTGVTSGRVMLIDDLVSTGSTIAHMLNRLKNGDKDRTIRNLEPVGFLLTCDPWIMRSTNDPASAKEERERWANKIGRKDVTGCKPLPGFFVRHVNEDQLWPALAGSAQEELPMMQEELPPITLKRGEVPPIVTKTVKSRRKPTDVPPRGFTIRRPISTRSSASTSR